MHFRKREDIDKIDKNLICIFCFLCFISPDIEIFPLLKLGNLQKISSPQICFSKSEILAKKLKITKILQKLTFLSFDRFLEHISSTIKPKTSRQNLLESRASEINHK